MAFRGLFGKIRTVLALLNQGKLLRTIKGSETDWQLTRRIKVWEARSLAQKPIRDTLLGGEIIELYPGDKVSELIYKRQFEKNEQEFVRQFLQTGDLFVDVGANLGLFTIIAAKRVGKSGRVFSFEPANVSYRRLLRNVALNGLSNVTCFEMALSREEEKRELIISLGEFAAWSSFAHPSAGNRFEAVTVPCTTWDKIAAERRISGKTTLMKIDVEGWELCVLDGATKELSGPDSPELLVEFAYDNLLNTGFSCGLLYEKLQALGYRMYQVDMQRRVLIPEKLKSNYAYVNLLATKREEFVMKRLKAVFAPDAP